MGTATTGYLESLSVRLAGGRFFDARDSKDAPKTVIIDDRLARTFWPGTDAVGRRLYLPNDPKDLTDSIVVAQELDTPGERTIRVQQGMELLKAGLIDYQKFFEEYDKTEDSRQAVIDMYVQQVVSYVMSGILPLGANPNTDPNGVQPVIKVVADSVRGALNYALLEQSPNYAIATAEAMAQQAAQQAQHAPQIPGQGLRIRF